MLLELVKHRMHKATEEEAIVDHRLKLKAFSSHLFHIIMSCKGVIMNDNAHCTFYL